jgi:hypothetical protein
VQAADRAPGTFVEILPPRASVNTRVASGAGAPFDPGHRRLMKEWATVPLRDGTDWERLGEEALQFVSSTLRRPGR